MRHSMKPDLRADYKIRLYTGPKTPFFEVSILHYNKSRSSRIDNFVLRLFSKVSMHR